MFFSTTQQLKIVRYRGFEVLIRPGDKCHVKSKRFDKIFTDGHVSEIYKDYVSVSYGFSEFFSYFSRGNTKNVSNEDIAKVLRFPTASIVKFASESLNEEERARLLGEVSSDED